MLVDRNPTYAEPSENSHNIGKLLIISNSGKSLVEVRVICNFLSFLVDNDSCPCLKVLLVAFNDDTRDTL